MDTDALDRQVVYVAGASRGIGRSVAQTLVDAGATVVGIARSSADLDSLGRMDRRLMTVTADVSDPEQIARAFRRANSEVGRPDLVLAFAGVAEALGPVHVVDVDDWWRAVEVDLRGTMLTVREALNAMLPVGAGRIVTVYGNLGDREGQNVSAFACAKAAIARLTEMAATEVSGTGVVVLGLHPGFVRTPMTEELAWGEAGTTWLPSFADDVEGRWRDAEAAARLVVRIALGDADGLTGRVLRIGDDVPALAKQSEISSDFRRLRLDLA